MVVKASLMKQKALAPTTPLLVRPSKKKKKKDKTSQKVADALALLDEFGLCPISREPMRRPVLPSSGQAFDEVNIVRYCSSGNRRCPVSGSALKIHKGRVVHTVDFNLRSLIRSQAALAKVKIPSIDRDVLLQEMRSTCLPETAKAIVDDCYLEYIQFSDLEELLAELSSGGSSTTISQEEATQGFQALLTECLACRHIEFVDLAIQYMKVHDSVWSDPKILYEALAVAQDPDCRGQVLVVLEDKIRRKMYSASQVKTLLNFETDSVPVQQFQARVAQAVIQHGGKGLAASESFAPIINMALRVREDLDGCVEGEMSIYDVWYLALCGLKNLECTLDADSLDRLFCRENRLVLQHLACAHEALLTWHLARHEHGLSLCVAVIGGRCGEGADKYSSDEDYMSEEDDMFQGEEMYEDAGGPFVMDRVPRSGPLVMDFASILNNRSRSTRRQ